MVKHVKNNTISSEEVISKPTMNEKVSKKDEVSGQPPKDSLSRLLLLLMIPLQILIFFSILIIGYKDQRISTKLQETIQGSAIEQLVGPQMINLENNEGDPRISWFDPGATLIFRGFVNGVEDNKLSLVAMDQKAYDIPIAKDRSISCLKELKSTCPCTDNCTLEHVASSIRISVHNYYESVDMPDGTVEDQIVSSRIFIE